MPACHICQQTLDVCTGLFVFQGLAMCRRIRISLYQFFDSYIWQHPFGDWYASLLICSYCSTNYSGTVSWFSGACAWVRHLSSWYQGPQQNEKKEQIYWEFFSEDRKNWIRVCAQPGIMLKNLQSCVQEKKKDQDFYCFKHCLTILALGLTVQNDETSAISQDNGSRSVFKPDFSRERRVDLAPTHITLKRCNLKSQLVTLLLNWSSEPCFPCPVLASIFLAADLGVFICAISLK